ncbi:MAG: class I tRNA ligase family protein [Planctomycetaceae bacterium]
MPRYDAGRIEPKWQAHWDEHATFQTSEAPPDGSTGKLYVLGMFPYPSGAGLHVGHPESYTATDIVSRYSRMRGKHVLHPMGWDAFGLPAEQHAIKTGVHPAVTTKQNTDNFRRQLKALGFSYDWSREFGTTDPDYFRWTQWIFLQLFDTWYDSGFEWSGSDGKPRRGKGRPIAELPLPKSVREQSETAVRRYQDRHRLAYQASAPVNWCPALGTVLANEEVIDGKSERGGHPVVRLPLRQWMLRITAYADRLADELDECDWPESVKALQRNWIGRSTGAEVDFYIGPETTPHRLHATHDEFEGWKTLRSASGFPADPGDEVIRVFTTRPDTLYGATYMVLAPEHPLVDRLTSESQRAAVAAYRQQAVGKSDLDRTDLAKEKTGVFTGSYALNPAGGEKVPIWIADYVLVSYGTGAIMAVPAHDLRDWEFACQFNLPIMHVVEPPPGYEPSKEEREHCRDCDGPNPDCPYTGLGTAINSGQYDGTPTDEFKPMITLALAAAGLGKEAVNYKLRDWLFSRQHFWGEPFPIWHELDANGEPTGLLRTDDAASLPVTLPENFEFKPHGRPDPPLEEAPSSWLYKTASDGTRLKRETNSMPQWAGSCWYYLRFADPHNDTAFIDPVKEKYWLPVDLYIGGAEHAVLHLLYSRFWHKVLFDRGCVSTAEPFRRLVNQGMILGEPCFEVYVRLDENGEYTDEYVSAEVADKESEETEQFGGDLVVEEDESGRRYWKGVFGQRPVPRDQLCLKGKELYWSDGTNEYQVTSRTYKMSKSRGNVVNPDDVVKDYGADALRLYEMFMGPLEATKPWQMSGVEGVSRFLGKVWRALTDEAADDVRLNAAVQDATPTEEQERLLHKTIKAVTNDVESLSFNTAISRMMEFINALSSQEVRPRSICEPFVLILSPFAPHLAEELWQVLGHGHSLAREPWPAFDESKIAEATVEIPVQVNGKLRSRVRVAAAAAADAMEAAAREDATVASNLEGKHVVKVVAVPGRMVNFVVK